MFNKEKFIEAVGNKKEELKGILKRNGKILLLTHQNCLDGRVCELMARRVFSNVLTVKIQSSGQDTLLEYYNIARFDAILMVDVGTKSPKLLNRRNLVLIDHHEAIPENKGKFVFTDEGACSSILFSLFLETVFDLDLSRFANMLELVDDYDLWKRKKEDSAILEHLFRKMTWDSFSERFRDGNVTFTPDELALWDEELKRKDVIWDEMLMHVDKNVILVVDERFDPDVLDRIFQKTKKIKAVVWVWHSRGGSVRIRDCYNLLDCGDFLGQLELGGGHGRVGGFKTGKYGSLSATVEVILKAMNMVEWEKMKEE